MKHLYKENQIIKKYDDGLVLRTAKKEDAEALAEFNGHVHADEGWDSFDKPVADYTRDIIMKNHPTVTLSDILITEDTKTKKIVASSILIAQTWSYEGISFGVGRPEIVGTHPDYRNRGLIRDIFEELHKISDYYGHQLQSITGIPFYYRLFEYEMTLALDGGGTIDLSKIKEIKENETEPFTIRDATDEDIPTLQAYYEQFAARNLIACVHDHSYWNYLLHEVSENTLVSRGLGIIEDSEKNSVGIISYGFWEAKGSLSLKVFEVKNGLSIAEVAPSVIRALKAKYVAKEKEVKSLHTKFETEHPIYDAMRHIFKSINSTYAWYIRIPNVIQFLNTITPAMERRLAESALVGYSGTLKLNFYRDGLQMHFENGKISKIEKWRATPHTDEGDSKYPFLTFYHLLMGHKSHQEVSAFFSDCFAKTEKEALVKILFPKKHSAMFALV